MGTLGRRNSGPPAWLVFLSSVALVFGAYYLWLGGRNYLATGGLGVVEATARAEVVASSTAAENARLAIPTTSPIPTFTPIPECQEWVVTVPSAIVRERPSTGSAIADTFEGGTEVCVIERVTDTAWYLIDRRSDTRRIEEAYMRGDVIRPLNPTATPSDTATPPPTVTPTVTATPSDTPVIVPTDTPDPNATPSPTTPPPPTATPPASATAPVISA